MNIFTSLIRRARERQGTAALLRLDDHLLNDIGITRDEVHRLMAGGRTAHGKRDRREG